MITFLKRVMCALLIFSIALYPATALAEENDPAALRAGEPAPFNGVLIPTLKAAEMTTRLEQAEPLCLAKTEAAVAAAVNKSNLLLSNCLDSKKIIQDMHNEQILAQKDYIKFLEKKVTAPQISKEWVFVIGVVAGVGLTIGAGYAMAELSQ